MEITKTSIGYKITDEDFLLYLDLEELVKLKEEIEHILEVESQEVMKETIDPYDTGASVTVSHKDMEKIRKKCGIKDVPAEL